MKNAVKIFSNHTIKIKQKLKLNNKFSLQCVLETTVGKFVKNLSSYKTIAGDFPVNVLRNSETCLFDLTKFTKPLEMISFQIP